MTINETEIRNILFGFGITAKEAAGGMIKYCQRGISASDLNKNQGGLKK